MKARALIILASAAILLGAIVVAHSSDKPYSKTIVDVSWPNCTAAPASTFGVGIIGVNGGLDFRPNPCLAEETTWFVHYALYINTGYPGDAHGRKFLASPRHCGVYNSQCLAYNYGFNAAIYAMRYANLQNAHTNQWWLDVETDNSWTTDSLINRESIKGMAAAIKQDVFFARVGIYSSSSQWDSITGQWQNGLPAWLATGGSSKAAATNACQDRAFTEGTTWLTQYTVGLDENLPCSTQFINHL
jgi:hypothetical protein